MHRSPTRHLWNFQGDMGISETDKVFTRAWLHLLILNGCQQISVQRIKGKIGHWKIGPGTLWVDMSTLSWLKCGTKQINSLTPIFIYTRKP